MCLYPHSNRYVLILGKCLGEVGCCTENRNAMSFVTSLNVIVTPNIAAIEISFYSLPRTALEKQSLYSVQKCFSGIKLLCKPTF